VVFPSYVVLGVYFFSGVGPAFGWCLFNGTSTGFLALHNYFNSTAQQSDACIIERVTNLAGKRLVLEQRGKILAL
jgi:hypothetical protein